MKKCMGVISELLVVSMFFALSSGCASIIKGGKQNVSVKSFPQGANCDVINAKTNDRMSNITTPTMITLERGSGYFRSGQYRIRCKSGDYPIQEAYLDGNLNGWYIGGNILLGGLIGWLIVDPLTGAMYTLEPEMVLIDFQDPTKSILKPVVTDNTQTKQHIFDNL